jgi:Zn-dependent protease with chaperone function
VQPAGIHLLANRRPAAFAWPDRHIYVTTGLLALLDDDELTAALAHELGHLQARDRHMAALRGPAADDIEARADALGCELLKAGGIRTGVLARALAKVRDAPDTPGQCREALTRRIEWLRLSDSAP